MRPSVLAPTTSETKFDTIDIKETNRPIILTPKFHQTAIFSGPSGHQIESRQRSIPATDPMLALPEAARTMPLPVAVAVPRAAVPTAAAPPVVVFC